MRKFENFCRALENLQELERYAPPYDNVVLTGLVGLYQICFEQAWKAMNEIMENEGLSAAAAGSPKAILKEAYRIGMIPDERKWLDALAARNHTAHAYNQAIALEIVEQTRAIYLPMFQDFRKSIEANHLL